MARPGLEPMVSGGYGTVTGVIILSVVEYGHLTSSRQDIYYTIRGNRSKWEI